MRTGIDQTTRLLYRRNQLVSQTMMLQNQLGALYNNAMQAKVICQQNYNAYNRSQCNKAIRDYNRAKQVIIKNQQKIIVIDQRLAMIGYKNQRQETKAQISEQIRTQKFINTVNRRGLQSAYRVNNPSNW